MTASSNLLILGGRDSSVEWLSEIGCQADLIQSPSGVTDLQRSAVNGLFLADPADRGTIVDIAQRNHRRQPYRSIVTFQEPWLLAAAAVGEALGVCWTPTAAIRTACDKAATRDALRAAGIDTVRYRRCPTLADAQAFLARAGAPIIVKPTGASGSRGVALVGTADELGAAWARAAACADGAVIVEEYIEGPEFSVETISWLGRHEVLAVTEKTTSGPPGFVELGHVVPASLPDADVEALSRLVVAVLDAIGHRSGPCHSEFRLSRTGPRVIETQTRPGGDQIWQLVQIATGRNVFRETLARLSGHPVDQAVCRQAGAAAIRFLAADRAGTVAALAGVAQAQASPGVVAVHLDVKAGDGVVVPASSSQRLGYVLAQADTPAEAVARAEAARAMIGIGLGR
jgi:biotin carboxylase